MKLFSDNRFFKIKNISSFIFNFTTVCATHHTQFGNKIENPVANNATDTSKYLLFFW
jgi:hypothetical protein